MPGSVGITPAAWDPHKAAISISFQASPPLSASPHVTRLPVILAQGFSARKIICSEHHLGKDRYQFSLSISRWGLVHSVYTMIDGAKARLISDYSEEVG